MGENKAGQGGIDNGGDITDPLTSRTSPHHPRLPFSSFFSCLAHNGMLFSFFFPLFVEAKSGGFSFFFFVLFLCLFVVEGQ